MSDPRFTAGSWSSQIEVDRKFYSSENDGCNRATDRY